MSKTTTTQQLMEMTRVDLGPTHEQPSTARLIVASIVAIVGSLAADALLSPWERSCSPPLSATCTSPSTTTPS